MKRGIMNECAGKYEAKQQKKNAKEEMNDDEWLNLNLNQNEIANNEWLMLKIYS